jgi:hypothetical protein
VITADEDGQVGKQGSGDLVRSCRPGQRLVVPLDLDAIQVAVTVSGADTAWDWPGTGSRAMTPAASAVLRPV